MMRALIRNLKSAPVVPPEPILEPASEQPVEPARAAGTEILDVIEAAVLAAIGGVGGSISAARGEVLAMRAGLAGIRAQMEDLAQVAEGAAASADLARHTDACPARRRGSPGR